MSYTSIMGAKQSITISNEEVKDDIPLSTNSVSKVTKNEECLQPENSSEFCKGDELIQPKTIEFRDSSGNITVILQHPIDVSGARPVQIVDTAGCGCIGCGIQVGTKNVEDIQRDMRTETKTSTIVKCHCGSQCMCVPPCECEYTKTPTVASTPVKSPWVVPHIFTKTTDIEKRLDDIEVRFNKLNELLNNNEKRIDTLETISKQMTEYVPLSAIPYCIHCETIVLNGQVCDCGLIVT
jgi:hypothetical protein